MICLYYIHDPMCSWCYAFSPSWTALQKELPNEIRVIDLLGGLAADTAEPMPIALQKSIQQAWQRIEQTVPGVRFNWDFWSRNTPVRSTYPACRAVLAARRQCPEAATEMVRAIQNAYYQKAMNPSLLSTLEECARDIGLDTGVFRTDLTSMAIERELQQEIQQARAMDVHSYPSLRLVHAGSAIPVTIDYRNPQNMLNEIRHILKKSKADEAI